MRSIASPLWPACVRVPCSSFKARISLKASLSSSPPGVSRKAWPLTGEGASGSGCGWRGAVPRAGSNQLVLRFLVCELRLYHPTGLIVCTWCTHLGPVLGAHSTSAMALGLGPSRGGIGQEAQAPRQGLQQRQVLGCGKRALACMLWRNLGLPWAGSSPDTKLLYDVTGLLLGSCRHTRGQ